MDLVTSPIYEATSFASASEIASYLTEKGYGVTLWNACPDQGLAAYLAALAIGRMRLRGVRACKEQILTFPRILPMQYAYIDDCTIPYDTWEELETAYDEQTLTYPIIPLDVKYAQIELIQQVMLEHISQASTFSAIEEASPGIKSISIGGKISIGFDTGVKEIEKTVSSFLTGILDNPIRIVQYLMQNYVAGVRGVYI